MIDSRPSRTGLSLRTRSDRALAIRRMVVTDWRFLLSEPAWVQEWIGHFHAGVDPALFIGYLEQLIDALKKLRTKQGRNKT